MNRPNPLQTHPGEAPSAGHEAWLSRSIWFIAVCGFVTGGFAALGDRGDELSAQQAAIPAAASGQAPADKRWKAPPPVSQQVATAGGAIPLAAPTAATPVSLGLKGDPAQAGERRGPTASKTAVVLVLLGILGGAALLLGKKKQAFGAPKDKQLEVVETIRVSGRYQLCLVRAAGRLLVLGTSDKGLSLLTTLGEGESIPEHVLSAVAHEAEPVATPAPVIPPRSHPSFSQVLAHAAQRPDPPPMPVQAPLAETRDSATRQLRSQEPPRSSAPQAPPRRRFINAHEFQEQARQEAAAAPSRDVFLDHLVGRLSAATPRSLRDVVSSDEPAAHAGGPLGRYQRSLA